MAARNRFFLGPSKKKWVRGGSGQERGFCRPFLFCEKETVRTPKKKFGPGSCRVLQSPAPRNTVITGKHPFRALRPAPVRLSGRDSTPRGRLGVIWTAAFPRCRAAAPAPGGRPEGVWICPESIARYRRRRAVALPAFSHRSPAPGGDELCPSLSHGPFSLAARNRFFLGQSKKKWVRETCRF